MRSFLSGKKEAPVPALARPATAGAAQALAALGRPATAEAGHLPNIDVVKEGDKVVRLVVTCSCGERMEVECIYPAGG